MSDLSISELKSQVIYPKLTHEIVFGDLEGFRSNGKGYDATCPSCKQPGHFYMMPDWSYGKCRKGSCTYHGKGHALAWWDHVAERYGLSSNRDILHKLADLAGVNLFDYSQSSQHCNSPMTVADVHRLFIRAGQRSAAEMPEKFEKYLAGRGFRKEEIRRAGIVYMEREPMLRLLFKAGCKKELIEQSGLFTIDYGEKYHIIMPYYDDNGTCQGYVARLDPWLKEEKNIPKYKNSYGSSRDVPFQFHLVQPGISNLIIVESPLDAYLINMKLGKKEVIAVALCGDTLTDAGMTLINQSALSFVHVALDDDLPGRNGNMAILLGLKKRSFVIPGFGGYKDPGELIPAKGPAAFQRAFESAVQSSKWIFGQITMSAPEHADAGWYMEKLCTFAPVYHAQERSVDKATFVREAREATLLHEKDILAAVGVN